MLYDIPTPLLILVLLAGMLVVVEVGLRVGRRYGQKTWANAHDIHTALTAATLALMGLMLAFTFDMSASRFDLRRTLIVTEASAIQSVRSNLDFLSAQPRAHGLDILHYYTGKRIAFLAVGHDTAAEQHAIDQSRAIQRELWRLATTPENYATTDKEVRGTQYQELTESLLELDRIARQREAARDRRVPEPVLFLLFALAIGAGAVLSYISGASGHPDRLPTYVVLILVCLVIYVIIDFDRPRRGLMRLDAGPLQNVLTG